MGGLAWSFANRWFRGLAIATLLGLASLPAAGQQLLTYRESGPVALEAAQRDGVPGPAPRARRFDVEVDLGLLRPPPETLLLATPDGHVLRAELRELTDRGDGAFLWSGHVAGAEWEPVLLTMASDGLSGIFAAPGEAQYELHANRAGAGVVLGAGWLAPAVQAENPDLAPVEPGADHSWCVTHSASADGVGGGVLRPEEASASSASVEPVGVALAQSATPGITLSVNPEEVREDAASALDVTVTATLDGALVGEDVSVDISVGGGTAVAGTDFAAVADFTVTIPAGTVSGEAVFSLDPVDDGLPEPHETIVVAGSASGFDVSSAEVEIVSDDVRQIDVIVLYTAPVRQALARAGLNPERDARFQFDYATTLLRQAGVAAEWRVVHAGNTPADFDRYVAARQGFAIRGMSHGTRTITRMRDRMNADIVHVMGAGDSAIWHCGQAYGRTVRNERIVDYGFWGQSTTNVSCAGSRGYRRWTLTAHEVGHTFGAHHERGRNAAGDGSVGSGLDEVNDVLGPYAFGFYERASPAFTTIMAYGAPGGQTRLNHYSNVRARYQGRAMGSPDRNEVERLLERTAPETADLSDHLTPGTPSGFTGTAVLNGSAVDITFTWTDESNRDVAQTIQYQVGGTGPWIEVARLAPDVRTATITGFEPGTLYNFRMYALNARGWGLRSETWSVTTPGTSLPAKPTGLGASAPQPAMVRLNWADNSHNETGFSVEYRKTGAPAWTSGPMVGADVETVDVTNLDHLTEHEFRVGAMNSRGTVFSETAFGLTLPEPPPAAPEGPDPVFGRRLTATSAHLRWMDRSADETGFRVQVRRPGDASWSVAQSLPADATEAFVTGLTANARHEFRVEATGAGASAVSRPIVLDLSAEPPPAIELTASLIRYDNVWIYADLKWKTVSPFSGDYRRWSKPASDPDSAWSPHRFTTSRETARHQQSSSNRIPMHFRVEAIGDGGSTLSNVIEVDFGSTFLGPPGSVSAEMWRPTEVRLTWTEASGASAYRVSQGETFDPVVYAVYPAAARQAIVTGLGPGRYTFRVEALDADGTATSRAAAFRLRRPANPPPTAVSDLAVDYPYLQTMRITWRDNSTDEDQFLLSVREDDGAWVDFTAGFSGNTEGGLTVEPSTLYHLRMLADHSTNGSLNSNIVTFWSTQEPTEVRATPSSSTAVDLSWKDNAIYEQSFQVQYKEAGTPAFFRQAATVDRNATAASADGLTAGTSYKFRVRSRVVNARGEYRWESSSQVTITMPPPPPSGVAAAAAGSTSATVTWTDESTDETGFVVEARTAGSEWSAVGRAGADAASAKVLGLAAGATVEFRVRAAHEANGLSSPSDVATLTMPPPPPSGLTASPAGPGSVTLAWTDESTDETGFVAEYKRSSEANWSTWGTEAPANAGALTLTGLTAGESYEFRVRAKKGTELSSPSAVAVVESLGAPVAASALAATASGPSTADLTWTDDSTDETGFDVQYRTAGGGAWATASMAAADSTSAAVSGLHSGRRYEFRVVAKNAHGSTPSGIVSLTMPPAAPTGLEGTPDGSTVVELTWTDNASGETGYRVDRRLAGSSAWTAAPAADPNAVSYTVEGLTASTAYEFRVVALSAAGESPSAPLALTTPPAPPSGLAASEAGPTSAALTWTDNSSDETGFLVEYRISRARTWTTYGTEAGANTTSITVSGLESGTPYGFRVVARHNVNGLSSPSGEALLGELGGPVAPSAVMATARGSSRVGVSWTDNSSDETGFLVERRRGADLWAAIAEAPPDATSAEVGPFLGGRTYELRVSSRNALAKRPSAGVSVTMPPAAPTGLSASEDGMTSVALSWSDESFDETGFVVEYRDSGSQAWTTHGTQAVADSGSMTISGLVQGGTYGFRVFADHSANGRSSPTGVVWVTDLGTPPAGAANVLVVATGSTGATVTWTDAATDETGFEVRYRAASGVWTTGATVAANSESATVDGLMGSTVYSFEVVATGSSASPSDPFVLTMPPAAPTDLVATEVRPGSDDPGVRLTWTDNATDERDFLVEYRAAGEEAWSAFSTRPPADSTSFETTELAAGGAYEFRVLAISRHGNSSPSNVASVGDLGVPEAPTDFAIMATGSTTALATWTDSSTKEAVFRVQRRSPGAEEWIEAALANRNETSVEVPDLLASTAYEFRVVSWTVSGSSGSNVATLTMPPAPPVDLVAGPASPTSVTLRWTDASLDETSFVAEYKRAQRKDWNVFATEAAANATSLTVTGLASGLTWEFRVYAKHNANGRSSPSNEARVRRLGAAGVPADVAATASGSTSVVLTWTDNGSDETGFRVEYRIGRRAWAGTEVAADSTTATVTGLLPSTSYEFRVSSLNAHGAAASDSVFLVMPPAAPTGLTAAQASSTSVSLAWTDASTDEDRFVTALVLSVAEGTSGPIGSPVSATDPESGAIAYSLTGADASSFVIDSATGQLSVGTGTTLNHEQKASYGFDIVATDDDASPLSASRAVTVNVADADVIMPPAAPSGVAATPQGAASVLLTWTDNSSNETGFVVEYREARTEAWTAFGTETLADATSVTVTGLAAGRSYDFRVIAKHATIGLSSPSEVTRAGAFGAPAPPTGLTVSTIDETSVRLEWTDESTNETGFEVEYRETNPGIWRKFETEAPANATSIVVTGLAAGTEYDFRVIAKSDSGLSTPSLPRTETTTTPPPFIPPNRPPTFDQDGPLALTVVESAAGPIGSVSATDPDGDRVSYGLSGPDARSFRMDPDGGVLSLSPRTSLDASRRDAYAFSVTASDGRLSAILAVTLTVVEPERPGDAPTALRPAPPSELEASLLTSDVVVLSWRDNADDETGFEVFRREDTGDWESSRSLPADTETATMENLAAGIEYEFAVTAKNAYGSTASNVASADLSLAPPTRMDAAPRSETSVRVTWRDNSLTETGFEVQARPVAPGEDEDAGDPGEGETAAAGWTVGAAVGPNATEALLTGLTPGGVYRFRVAALSPRPGGDPALSAVGTFRLLEPPPPGAMTDCEPGGSVVTLGGDYEVAMCFETPSGAQMDASNYHLESTASGLLYFFDRDNVEVLVKVLDGCAINGHRWVFVAPVTTLAFSLEITERSTGRRFAHRNPKSLTAETRADTAAFPCEPEARAAAAALNAVTGGPIRPRGASENAVPQAAVDPSTAAAAAAVTEPALPICEPEGPGILLEDGHRIDMCFEMPNGEIRQARDWGLTRRSTALLYFFDRENAEVLVKVLDGCAVNGRRWVFAAPVTDLAFHLVVTDPAGRRWTHSNEAGRTASPGSDTAAFACD